MYNQKCALHGFNQHNLTNENYYYQSNSKVDVGETIGITRQYRLIMEDTSQEIF